MVALATVFLAGLRWTCRAAGTACATLSYPPQNARAKGVRKVSQIQQEQDDDRPVRLSDAQ
jgi:hypothetical protein